MIIIISDWYIFVGRLVLSLFHGVHASLWQVQQHPAQSQKNKLSSIHNKNFWFEISNIVKILPDLDGSCRILTDLAGV